MGFLKRLKKKKFARMALAGVTLGGSEIYYHKKQIRRGIKQNKGLIIGAAGAALGIPALGGLFGGSSEQQYAPPAPEPEAPPVQQAGMDPRILLFGGGAILLVLLLSKRK